MSQNPECRSKLEVPSRPSGIPKVAIALPNEADAETFRDTRGNLASWTCVEDPCV